MLPAAIAQRSMGRPAREAVISIGRLFGIRRVVAAALSP